MGQDLIREWYLGGNEMNEPTNGYRSGDDFIDHLIAEHHRHLAAEPPSDAGGHPSLPVHEAQGAVWAEWKQTEMHLRRLIGIRLANVALTAASAEAHAHG